MVDSSSAVIAVIPARWGSTRFPGKVLAPIAGEPMIAHVVRRARAASTVGAVVVATDDQRVADVAVLAGAEAVVTGACASGTDRVAAAVLLRPGWEIVVNLQGDEPLLAAENIDTLVAGMLALPAVGIATLCRPLEARRIDDPNAVKVVRAADGRALYFSRAGIPYPRDSESARRLWRLHLGVYGFRRPSLARFVALPQSPLELAEGLEQLRALESGMEIAVFDAPRPAFGVDTPEDLAEVERIMRSEVT
jgi:3-deoxy-manno-octulosonate cytidylyltransferase (CMP-KDO synthetase)